MDELNYTPHYSNSRALIIGINKYSTASPLEYAVKDARAVGKILKSRFGFPEDSIRILINKDATRSKIMDSYMAFANRDSENDDRILFFFAGHGHTQTGKRGEVGFLVPYDGDVNILSSLIRWDDLTKNAELIHAKHILYVMDACYGGLAITRALPPGSTRFLKDMLQRYSRQVLTAGKADEIVSDSGGPIPNHSVFTGHFIQGLEGKAANEDGVITANGVMSYVYEKVAKDPYSQQTPHYGYLDGDGDFIFNASIPILSKLTDEDDINKDILVPVPSFLSESSSAEKINLIKITKEYLSDRKHKIKNDDAIINRLDELYELYKGADQNVKKLPLNSNTKYALFSDLHLGDGKKADNFARNEETMIFALNYYKKNGYSLILLGDVEELWQFDLIRIQNRYDKNIYDLIRSFTDNKVYRIFGNHDREWKRPPDPILNDENLPHGTPEVIMLGDDIFLVHGHQGDYFCDKVVWFSKYWARSAKSLVPVGKMFGYENRSAEKSQIPKSREKLYYNWAKDNKVILICGHTHNAIFASRSYYWWLKEQIKQKKLERERYPKDKAKRRELSKELRNHKRNLRHEEMRGRKYNRITTKGEPLPCYFNTGCGLYRKGLTNIEIEGDKIRLIKWQSDDSLLLEQRRKELWEEESLSELREKINI